MSQKVFSVAVLMALSGTASAINKPEAVELALAHAQNHRVELRASANDKFAVRDVFVDPVKGYTVARVGRTYKGLPVIGGDSVQRFHGNEFHGINQTLNTTARPAIRPSISGDQAIVEAGVHFGTGFNGVPTSHLVIYALGASPVLAYEVVFAGTKRDQTPTDMHYFVDARDGRILDKWDTVQTAESATVKTPYSAPGKWLATQAVAAAGSAGTANTLYMGTVPLTTKAITGGFELRDPTRGNSYTINGHTGRTSGLIYKDVDNAWGDGTNVDAASAAGEVQYGVAVTWDFYKNMLGRNGIANNGKGSYNRVHYGVKYSNAFWSDACFCMTFGDGDGVTLGPLVSLDVSGHEMSHGVTSRTAGLVYSGEPGGLNEATSDIFGTMVEFYANNTADAPDYLIGEKIYLANVAGSSSLKALRYMYDPIKDGKSPNCYVGTLGDLDVHYSSGVANRFFYLLAEGSGARTYSGVNHMVPTCDGSTVAGIGRDKAAKIWYRALTVYMTSATDYAGAATATASAATDLFGSTSAERAAVIAAWRAVSVPAS